MIDFKDGRWIIHASVRDTERITTIPEARANRKSEPGTAVWRVPGTLGAAKQIHNTLPEMKWTTEAKDIRARLTKQRQLRIASAEGTIPPLVHEIRLSDMQNRGVNWLLAGSGVLADDMGSGKTVMACVAADHSRVGTTLILTTKSTIGVWADHLKEWTSIRPFIHHGTQAQQKKAYEEYLAYEGRKALISTHALAGTHSKQASFGNIAAAGEPGRFNDHYDLCIIDEAHKMGVNPKNKWVRSMWAIGRNCDLRWALTGTPVNDNPEDLWVLMRFAEPEVFGQYRNKFRDRYCVMVDNGYALVNTGLHPDTSDEFQWVLRPHLMRRLKRQVVEGLPDAMPTQYITLPMTPKQTKAYKEMIKTMMAEVGEGLLITPDGLGQHQSCEYIADGMPILDEDTGRVISLDPDRTSSNKLDFILDIAEQRAGDPFVVYAYSAKTVTMLAEGLAAKGYEVGTIQGRTPQGTRDAYIRLFQEGKMDVILLTDAGAEGITLTTADLVIFARESWRAPSNQQVKDRIDRWGQTRPPHTIVLLSEGTIDESRRRALVHKVSIQEQVLQDKKKIKALLTGAGLQEVF